MSASQHLKDLAISETGFVFDPYTGATFTTNATGQCIIAALREGLPVEAIAKRLRDQFDVQTLNLEGDIADFLALLRQHGILSEEASR